MPDMQQIKNEYPEPLQGYERAIVREYLQVKILQAVFESTQASNLSFLDCEIGAAHDLNLRARK